MLEIQLMEQVLIENTRSKKEVKELGLHPVGYKLHFTICEKGKRLPLGVSESLHWKLMPQLIVPWRALGGVETKY